MITAEDRDKLKKIIGPKWVNKINKYFVENRIYNRYDNPYTSQFLSKVFNAAVDNPKVEAAIWDFAEIRKAEKEAEQKRRDAILDGINSDDDE
jgi:hypothetical protein